MSKIRSSDGVAYNSKRHGPVKQLPEYELVDPPPAPTISVPLTEQELATLWLACAVLWRQLIYPTAELSQELQEQLLDTCEGTWKRIVDVLNGHQE